MPNLEHATPTPLKIKHIRQLATQAPLHLHQLVRITTLKSGHRIASSFSFCWCSTSVK